MPRPFEPDPARFALGSPANLLTLSRIATAPIFALAFAQQSTAGNAVAIGIVVLALASDTLDGWLARRQKSVSSFGKIMDPLADCIFFLCVFGSFAWFGWIPGWLLAVFLGREGTMYGLLRPYAASRGFVLAARPLGKLKTALQGAATLLVMILATFGEPVLGLAPAAALALAPWIVGTALALSVASLADYVGVVVRLGRA